MAGFLSTSGSGVSSFSFGTGAVFGSSTSSAPSGAPQLGGMSGSSASSAFSFGSLAGTATGGGFGAGFGSSSETPFGSMVGSSTFGARAVGDTPSIGVTFGTPASSPLFGGGLASSVFSSSPGSSFSHTSGTYPATFGTPSTSFSNLFSQTTPTSASSSSAPLSSTGGSAVFASTSSGQTGFSFGKAATVPPSFASSGASSFAATPLGFSAPGKSPTPALGVTSSTSFSSPSPFRVSSSSSSATTTFAGGFLITSSGPSAPAFPTGGSGTSTMGFGTSTGASSFSIPSLSGPSFPGFGLPVPVSLASAGSSPTFGISTSAPTVFTPSAALVSGTDLSTSATSSASATPSAGGTFGAFKFAMGSNSSVKDASMPAVSLSVITSVAAATSTTAAPTQTMANVLQGVQRTPRPPLEITGKTVEEIIKEWTCELQERTAKFRKQAEALGEWDRRIISNRNVLIKVEIEVAKVVESQHSLERQLELIETYQQEVERALDSMEEEAERLYDEERPGLLEDEPAATRDKMFEQAEFVERELECLGAKLRETIQNVNSAQGGDLDELDRASPLDLVVQILNNQLSSLLWINEKSGELSGRSQKLLSDQVSFHDSGFVGSWMMRGA